MLIIRANESTGSSFNLQHHAEYFFNQRNNECAITIVYINIQTQYLHIQDFRPYTVTYTPQSILFFLNF